MKYKDMEGGIKNTTILHIEGDVVQDKNEREVARVHQNKVMFGTEEHKLRLAIIKPVIKPIKNKEEKEVAKDIVKKARILVEFLNSNNNLPIFSQVISQPIWNQKGIKRKHNSHYEVGSVGESGTFVADRQESDTPCTDPAESQSPTTHNSNEGVPLEAAIPAVYWDVTKLIQSGVDEHAIILPEGELLIFLLLAQGTKIFLCRHQHPHFSWAVSKL